MSVDISVFSSMTLSGSPSVCPGGDAGMGCSAVMVVASSDLDFLVGVSGCGVSEDLCASGIYEGMMIKKGSKHRVNSWCRHRDSSLSRRRPPRLHILLFVNHDYLLFFLSVSYFQPYGRQTSMTQLQPYREGLDIPQSVTITSGPAPLRSAHDDIDEYTSPSGSPVQPSADVPPRASINRQTEKETEPHIYEPLPKHAAWREWNINPSHHGPERLKHPPVFVKSQTAYDELGRSVVDGIGVEVNLGKDGGKPDKILDNGDSVKDWYLNLAKKSDLQQEDSQLSSKSAVSATKTAMKPVKTSSHPSPSAEAIRIHPSEWFIRRALLSKSQTTNSTPETSRPATPSSVTSLLTMPPQAQPKKMAPNYALGPENKGYGMLKGFGWGGGGLGKPKGWQEENADPTKEDRKEKRRGESDDEIQEIDASVNAIIDLTISSSEESSSEDEEAPSGPGRTAPIPTALKLDRLGVGHRSASESKITHSHKEIVQAQKRAKYGQRRIKKGEEKGETGKKQKIDWKKKDRREREERRRLMAALNS